MNNENLNNLKLKDNAFGYHTKECSENYSKGRPSYPRECIEFIKGLGLSNDSVVVDLASGPAKFTKVLAIEGGFNNITCIEPSSDFRNECEKVLNQIKIENNPFLNFKVLEGLSTSIPLKDNSVDCITVATAWHWFSNIESVREISRVLKPNGILVIIWNIVKFGDENPKNPPQLQNIIRLHRDQKFNVNNHLPTKLLREKWRDVFDEMKNDPKTHIYLNPDLSKSPSSFPNPQITNGEKTIASSLSMSYISLLPPNEKQQFINELKQNLENFHLTSNNKEFTVYYDTEVFYTRKPFLN
ncbi:hypothetical protein RB653_009170 [Dictyostelium firmibasis]|uniref:Methyltransferase type 11 domain-containing protein n=1 Tax=Dictyostelium firmibasis TaxID=79012 RepID=A0AAN7YX57_9MYCE